MKKIKSTPIKKYTALALALAFVSPVISHASESKEETLNKPAVIENKDIENKDIEDKKSYDLTYETNLAEDGKTITYDITIKKTEESSSNLSVFAYILPNSNLENLSLGATSDELLSEEINKDLANGLRLDLKDSKESKISLKATIKDNKKENLDLDLGLIDDKEHKQIVHLANKVEIKDDKKDLVDLSKSGLTNRLVGKLEDKTLSWTDYLVNASDKDIKTDYELKVTDNQDVKNQKLEVKYYDLSENGFTLSKSEELDLGTIKDLEIPANTLVNLSFTTKPLVDAENYQINDAIVEAKKPSEKESQPKDEEKSEEKLEAKENLDEKPAEDQAKDLTADLEDTTEEIKEILKANENEADGKKVEELKTDDKASTDNKTSDEETKLSEVKTVNLDESKDETDKEKEAQKLISKLKDTSKQISDILKEVDAEVPQTIMNQPTSEKKETKAEGDLSADELIEKLNKTSKQIEQTVKSVVDEETYEKLISKSSNKEADPSKEEKAKALIKTLKEKTAEIQELLVQIELGVEADNILEDPEQIANISTLLDDVENLDQKSKEALGQNKKEDETLISPHFKIIDDKFSKEVYKKLEKVVTVTLDPLEKKKPTMAKDEIRKQYPSISHYLENLELRSDLLNNLK